MNRKRLTLSILLVLIALSAPGYQFRTSAQRMLAPPRTRTDNVAEVIHGVSIADPYRWLEDQDSPETRAWINEQNQYAQTVLSGLSGRDAIHKRLEQLLKVDTVGIPAERSGRYFYTRRRADQNQSVIYLREGLNGKEEALIDPNKMSVDQATSVSVADITEDGKWLAYNVRQGGKDETSIHFMDVDARKDASEQFAEARYSGINILPDKSGVYYSKSIYPEGQKQTVSRVYYHAMGTPQSQDKMIFGEGYTATDIISPDVSLDGHYLILYVFHGSSGDNTDVFMKDLKNDGPFTPIAKDLKAAFNGTVVFDNQLYVLTNFKAPNRRVIDIDLRNPAPDKWRDVIPEGQSVINTFGVVGGKIFVNYLENVATKTRVYDLTGKFVRDLSFPTIGNASGMFGRPAKDEGFYTFSSFAQPATVYRYSASTGKQEVWARSNVPVNSAEIEVKQVWFDSKDGTKIPMFLVFKKGLKLDGNRPVFLTGYGGFNLRQTPSFSSTAAFWAEHDGVYALPSLRGGGEFGEKWHQAGMFGNKQNVFDDFIAAAEWLIKNNYTKPKRLAISGGSNGGLLVGAALTQRPDLYQAVVCSYPLLDMVRYHKFLAARYWVTEYGSTDDADQFPYIYKYSPYHNVKAGTKYPAVLLITGDSDTRVAPLHARKMTALLQASTGSDRPVLLHYDTKAGHSGGAPIGKQIDDSTDTLSFLFWQLGITP